MQDQCCRRHAVLLAGFTLRDRTVLCTLGRSFLSSNRRVSGAFAALASLVAAFLTLVTLLPRVTPTVSESVKPGAPCNCALKHGAPP
jgi:hypothetical protein